MAGVRSLVASGCLYVWIKAKGMNLFPSTSVLLRAFSFFTPVFGVFLSGALILGELISPRLIVALTLVSLGMVLVNRQVGAKVSPFQPNLRSKI
jgi:drug/metabolite transporter (DMT)-like permease